MNSGTGVGQSTLNNNCNSGRMERAIVEYKGCRGLTRRQREGGAKLIRDLDLRGKC